MNKVRRGEIAIALIKYGASTNNSRVLSNDPLIVDKITKATGVPAHELQEFVQELLRQLYDERVASGEILTNAKPSKR